MAKHRGTCREPLFEPELLFDPEPQSRGPGRTIRTRFETTRAAHHLRAAHSDLSLEAATGVEPVYEGFADLCLATWLRRQKKLERETGLEPATLALARRCSTTELFPHDSL